MRFVGIEIYLLNIPFVEAFRHSLSERSCSDAIVVAVKDDCGNTGYGEGLARAYVTGETRASAVARILDVFWPAIRERHFSDAAELYELDAALPDEPVLEGISDGASRSACSLAMLDCALRRGGKHISDLVPNRKKSVEYSGVVTAGSIEKAVRTASQFKQIGIRNIKVKVGFENDIARVAAIRDAIGGEASLRIDANGAWTVSEAATLLNEMRYLDIASVEQPLARGPVEELVRLKRQVEIPLMADESLITLSDARELVAANAVDYFNIRISKCGGFARALQCAHIAREAGIGIQIGSQVGETAILSAAGRALSATIQDVAFTEGSFGTLLLSEDVTVDGIRFGHRGMAPVLHGAGFGIHVARERLQKYAEKIVTR